MASVDRALVIKSQCLTDAELPASLGATATLMTYTSVNSCMSCAAAEACVGLEFDGQDCNSLRMLAGQASAFMSASVQAAEQFRFLGLS